MEDVTEMLEFKLMDKCVMENMRTRLKLDIEFYKKKIVITKRSLGLFAFNLKAMQGQSQNLHT
jgi:hypothetical protein